MTVVEFQVNPGAGLQGRLRVPGDKSISHRALMLGALAEGITEVSGFLAGEDCLATLAACRALGVTIEGPDAAGTLRIHGVGRDGLRAAAAPLDLGNSGTSMRLLSGLLAGQPFASVLTGDASLSRRPMRRVIEPLTRMGARIEATPAGTAPLRIHGGQRLRGIEYRLPVASAQVKSCLLLAGLYADGRTCVREPAPSRDHTERMLRAFGYPLEQEGDRVCLDGGGRLRATPIAVPADLSSAAFFLVGASIAGSGELWLEQVGINPTRAGILTLLQAMGADLTLLNERQLGGEPVADIRVRPAPLHGIAIPPALVPLAIDEFPALFVAAACAQGETVLTGAAELRVKESDRIQVMADALQALDIVAQPLPDGIRIQGGTLGGGVVDSHGDHRIAMSLAMAALRARAPIRILDCANVATSFPGFVELAAGAGLPIHCSPVAAAGERP
jgi:3-phosphoshikimate 1-carboxyvinyltransferase